jgi:predicted transcriptional regulator of viral defense system
MASTKTDQLLRLARGGPVRARDLAAAAIPRTYLKRLTERNLLEHAGRGLYRIPDAEVTELHALAEVQKRVPQATICLLSALQVHGLTTEVPHAVWIMIDSRARTPKLDTPALEIVRAHGSAREHGVTRRTVEGVTVAITSPAKTVADCFRYRRHVGLDVAIAALRAYLGKARAPRRKQGDYTVNALVEASRASRIFSVVRPYMDALA